MKIIDMKLQLNILQPVIRTGPEIDPWDDTVNERYRPVMKEIFLTEIVLSDQVRFCKNMTNRLAREIRIRGDNSPYPYYIDETVALRIEELQPESFSI
jgi:hypothetical protein